MSNDNFNLAEERPVEGLEEFAPQFLKDRQREFAPYRETERVEDFETLRKLAHQWKGFSEPYGFQTLGVLAQELEVCAKAEDQPGCLRLFGEIDRYLTAKEQSLSSQ